MTSFVLSTLVFFVVGFFARRYLDEQGLSRGMLRTLLVFLVALLASLVTASAVDWVDARYKGTAEPKSALGELPFGGVAHRSPDDQPFTAR